MEDKEKLICRLKKSLHGLKQAPWQWYKKFDSFIIENGFKHTTTDPCVYVKWFGESFVLLLFYFDDRLILGKDMSIISRLKDLSNSFAMKDLRPAKQILGMQISRDTRAKRIWLSQERRSRRCWRGLV